MVSPKMNKLFTTLKFVYFFQFQLDERLEAALPVVYSFIHHTTNIIQFYNQQELQVPFTTTL
jgi:hypothetical protein